MPCLPEKFQVKSWDEKFKVMHSEPLNSSDKWIFCQYSQLDFFSIILVIRNCTRQSIPIFRFQKYRFCIWVYNLCRIEVVSQYEVWSENIYIPPLFSTENIISVFICHLNWFPKTDKVTCLLMKNTGKTYCEFFSYFFTKSYLCAYW